MGLGVGGEKEERDLFGRLLGATDPETGDGLNRPELIAESAMLIIAGESPVFPAQLQPQHTQNS
jgi:hypothetical protein